KNASIFLLLGIIAYSNLTDLSMEASNYHQVPV
ncbi:hypothetical protein X975_00945, partial [Stegodyphus mimosarum]